MNPSTRLLLFSSSRLWKWFLGTEYEAIGVQGHSLDNAGWWYVCNRSLGSNEYLGWPVVLRQQVNEWVHLPTAPSKILHCGPSSGRNLHIRPEMTHVVFLSLHCLRVDIWKRGTRWVTTEDLFRESMLGIFRLLLFFRLWLNKHLPQALGGQIIDSLVCGGISEDIWYSLLQFLDGNGESIGLIRFDHLQERIISNVAEILDLWLQTPVPLVLLQKLMLVEKSGIESAHGVVTLHSTVHNSSVSLLGDALLCNLRVDPVWESPHLGIDGSELHSATCIILDRLLECRVELRIVKKDVWVMIPSVEMSLNRLDRLDDTIQLLISCQYHKRRIRSRFRGIRL